jgi:branched-chain amino acid transport system substrate-binding protein
MRTNVDMSATNSISGSAPNGSGRLASERSKQAGARRATVTSGTAGLVNQPVDRFPVAMTRTARSRRRLLAAVAAIATGTFARSSLAAGNANEIVLGMSLPLTGVLSSTARGFREGSRIAFEDLNVAGGVHGRKIRIELMDDKFDKDFVVRNATAMLDQGVLCLFGFMGTPGILAVSALVNERQVPLIGAVSGAPAAKDPKNKFVFIVRTSFVKEAESAVNVGVITGVKVWGVVYQDDGQGKAALAGVQTGLARHQLKAALEVAFPPAAKPDFGDALARIQSSQLGALVFGGSAPALAALVSQAKAKGIKLPATTVLSVVSPETAIALLGDDAIGLRFTQPVPYPFSLRAGAAAEYLESVRRHSNEPPSFIGMEGFLSARLMIKALQMTPSLQRNSLVASLESMNNYPLAKDFRVTFGPADRAGATYVDTMIVGRGRRIVR